MSRWPAWFWSLLDDGPVYNQPLAKATKPAAVVTPDTLRPVLKQLKQKAARKRGR